MKYAFIMAPGSGKTTFAKLHERLIDIDSMITYTPYLLQLIKDKKWEELALKKVWEVKNHLENNFKEGNIILLLHAPKEALLLQAKVLGYYKAPLVEVKKCGRGKYWHSYTKVEVLSYKDIKRKLLEAINQYL